MNLEQAGVVTAIAATVIAGLVGLMKLVIAERRGGTQPGGETVAYLDERIDELKRELDTERRERAIENQQHLAEMQKLWNQMSELKTDLAVARSELSTYRRGQQS